MPGMLGPSRGSVGSGASTGGSGITAGCRVGTAPAIAAPRSADSTYMIRSVPRSPAATRDFANL